MAVESGLTEKVRGVEDNLFIFSFIATLSLLFPLSLPLPPEYPCAAGISVPPLLPVGHRSYR